MSLTCSNESVSAWLCLRSAVRRFRFFGAGEGTCKGIGIDKRFISVGAIFSTLFLTVCPRTALAFRFSNMIFVVWRATFPPRPYRSAHCVASNANQRLPGAGGNSTGTYLPLPTYLTYHDVLLRGNSCAVSNLYLLSHQQEYITWTTISQYLPRRPPLHAADSTPPL